MSNKFLADATPIINGHVNNVLRLWELKRSVLGPDVYVPLSHTGTHLLARWTNDWSSDLVCFINQYSPFDARNDLIKMTSDQISQIAFAQSFDQLPVAIEEAKMLLRQKAEGKASGQVEFKAGKSRMGQHLDL